MEPKERRAVLAAYPPTTCPICSAVIADWGKHRDWHVAGAQRDYIALTQHAPRGS